jgi:hypothetical protein
MLDNFIIWTYRHQSQTIEVPFLQQSEIAASSEREATVAQGKDKRDTEDVNSAIYWHVLLLPSRIIHQPRRMKALRDRSRRSDPAGRSKAIT